MYLGMKLDQYNEYLNKVIDEIMDPQTRNYGVQALSYLVYSNIEFNMYTQLYTEVVYCIKDIYSKSNYTDKIKVFYEHYIPVNTVDYLDLYYLSYNKYNLSNNYFLNQFNSITQDVMMLMFLFSTTDIPLNLVRILEEVIIFMNTLYISVEDFMEVINKTFQKFLAERFASIYDSYASVPYDNRLPVITKEFLFNEYIEVIEKYKRLIKNINDNSLKVGILYKLLLDIKHIISTYTPGIDLDYMFRSYVISAVQNLIYSYSSEIMELNSDNDIAAYITLNNIIILCKHLKVYIPTMFDYNVVKGFI